MDANNKILNIAVEEIKDIPLQELKELSYILTSQDVEKMSFKRKWNILRALGYKVTSFVNFIAKRAKRSDNMVYRVYWDEDKHRNASIQDAMTVLFCTKLKIPIEETTGINT